MMNNLWRYYRYLVQRHFLSWRMLAVFIFVVLTMDSFLAAIRIYCQELNIKMSQWGFALIWDNKYVGLCFLLIFIFAASIFPEDRTKDRYIIARLGISKWVIGQSLYLITFGWIYTFFLYIVQNFLLWNVMEITSAWGKGWGTLSSNNVIQQYDIYISVPYLVISNYNPLQANILVVIIMGLLLGMIGMLIFLLNFYSKVAGSLIASAIIFMSLAASKNNLLHRYSPASWIRLDSHYRITSTNQPTVMYIIGMLILWTSMFIVLAKIRANQTQENNRRYK